MVFDNIRRVFEAWRQGTLTRTRTSEYMLKEEEGGGKNHSKIAATSFAAITPVQENKRRSHNVEFSSAIAAKSDGNLAYVPSYKKPSGQGETLPTKTSTQSMPTLLTKDNANHHHQKSHANNVDDKTGKLGKSSSQPSVCSAKVDDPSVLHKTLLNLFFHQKELELAFEEDFFLANGKRLLATICIITILNFILWSVEAFVPSESPTDLNLLIVSHVSHIIMFILSIFLGAWILVRNPFLAEKYSNYRFYQIASFIIDHIQKLFTAGKPNSNIVTKTENQQDESVQQNKIETVNHNVEVLDQLNTVSMGTSNFLGSRRTSAAYDTSRESEKSYKSKPTNENTNTTHNKILLEELARKINEASPKQQNENDVSRSQSSNGQGHIVMGNVVNKSLSSVSGQLTPSLGKKTSLAEAISKPAFFYYEERKRMSRLNSQIGNAPVGLMYQDSKRPSDKPDESLTESLNGNQLFGGAGTCNNENLSEKLHEKTTSPSFISTDKLNSSESNNAADDKSKMENRPDSVKSTPPFHVNSELDKSLKDFTSIRYQCRALTVYFGIFFYVSSLATFNWASSIQFSREWLLHSLMIVLVHVASGLKLNYLLYFDMSIIFLDIIKLFTLRMTDMPRIQVTIGFVVFSFIMYWLQHSIEYAKRIEFYLRLEVMRGQRAVTVAKEYEDIDKAKNAFLANVSHEIRTPLNGVMGLTQVLMETGLTIDQMEYTRLILSTAERLSLLINDILDLSKMEAQKLELRVLPSDLTSIVSEVIELMSFSIFQKGIEFVTYVEPCVEVLCDGNRMKQILLNLLTNALKFTNKGFIEVVMEKQEETAKTVTIRLSVTDSGIGIKENDLPALFNRFSQIDNSLQRQYHGAGLGLAVCHQLIQLMGGSITVYSEYGCGTSFRALLTFEKVLESRKSSQSRQSIDYAPEKLSSSDKRSAVGIREIADISKTESSTEDSHIGISSARTSTGGNAVVKPMRRVSSLDDALMMAGIPRQTSKTDKSGSNQNIGTLSVNALSLNSGGNNNVSSSGSTTNMLNINGSKAVKMAIVIDSGFAIRRSLYNSLADLGIHSFTYSDFQSFQSSIGDELTGHQANVLDRRSSSPLPTGFLETAMGDWIKFEETIVRDHLKPLTMNINSNDMIPIFISLPVLEKLVSDEMALMADWENQLTDEGIYQLVKQTLQKFCLKIAVNLTNIRKGKVDTPIVADRLKPVVMIRRVDQTEINNSNVLQNLGKYYLPSVNSTADFNAARRFSISSNTQSSSTAAGPTGNIMSRKSLVEGNALYARIHKNMKIDTSVTSSNNPSSPGWGNSNFNSGNPQTTATSPLFTDLQRLMLKLLMKQRTNLNGVSNGYGGSGNLAMYSGSFDIIYKPIYFNTLAKVLKEMAGKPEKQLISNSTLIQDLSASAFDWTSLIDITAQDQVMKTPPVTSNGFNWGTTLTTITSVSRNTMIESKVSLNSDELEKEKSNTNVAHNNGNTPTGPLEASNNNLSTIHSHSSCDTDEPVSSGVLSRDSLDRDEGTSKGWAAATGKREQTTPSRKTSAGNSESRRRSSDSEREQYFKKTVDIMPLVPATPKHELDNPFEKTGSTKSSKMKNISEGSAYVTNGNPINPIKIKLTDDLMRSKTLNGSLEGSGHIFTKSLDDATKIDDPASFQIPRSISNGSSSRSPLSDKGKEKRVLVAEDNPVNQIVTKKFLESGGYIADIANNGKEAVEYFKRGLEKNRAYDVILMDIQMPIVDGHMATGMIVQLEKEMGLTHTPIIAVTAHAFEYEIIDAVKSGMDDLVTKPLKKAILLEKVGKFASLAASNPNSNSSSNSNNNNNNSNSNSNSNNGNNNSQSAITSVPLYNMPSSSKKVVTSQNSRSQQQSLSSPLTRNPSQLHQSHRFEGSSEENSMERDEVLKNIEN